jgi:EmrB/QacA subfamily drug resistance transporter
VPGGTAAYDARSDGSSGLCPWCWSQPLAARPESGKASAAPESTGRGRAAGFDVRVTETAGRTPQSAAAAGTTLVLFTLASGQFLMTLDSSVMNVSIATVAEDVGTTVTGIQGAITAYTLVMAAFMITGAKIGAIIGRKRAFAIGCVIYGCGSFTTAISPSLPVLLFGWSLLEGLGAALILPAIVALVAGNFPTERRPAAYGLVAAAGAIAVAVGPLIGGFFTTYFSWRWVFAGEVVIVLVILLLTRRIADAPAEERPSLDFVGTALSAAGLGMLVFGVLRSSEWGWIQPKPDGPSWAGVSPTTWLILAGIFVIWLFSRWEVRRTERGQEPLVRPGLLKNRQLSGGLLMFFFQYLVQAGIFFVVPLYLSVCLGLSALETGARLLPLSVTLLIAAIGIPRFFPNVSPRLVVRGGLLALLAGAVVLLAALDADAGAEIVFVPMLLVGLGIGALASQLGSVTVSAVPDEESPEVGGVQNTMTNLGASLGTALAGSVMIAAVATSFLANIQENPTIPAEAKQTAEVKLASGVPFVSDADLERALDEADVPQTTTAAALDAYDDARIDGLKRALAILALLALVALFFAQRIPTVQPAAAARQE